MMHHTLFLSLVGIVIAAMGLLAYYTDRRILRKIELHEQRMMDKGIYKRHFTQQKQQHHKKSSHKKMK